MDRSSTPPLPSASAAVEDNNEPNSITADEVNIAEALEPQHQSCLQLLQSALTNPDQLIHPYHDIYRITTTTTTVKKRMTNKIRL